jgi:hypothetical protein
LEVEQGYMAARPPVAVAEDVDTASAEIDPARPQKNGKNLGIFPEERAGSSEFCAARRLDLS